MAIKSKISKAVSSQIGPLQGKLRSTVQKKVLELLKEFANGCPNVERMKQILKIKDNLLKIINSFQKRVDAIKPIVSKLQPVVTVAKVALEVIKKIPVPTAIIPPQTGGLGVPMSVLNTYSNTITTLTTTIDVVEGDIKAVNSIISSITTPLSTLRDRLQAIDIKIAECSKNSSNPKEILKAAQPPENTGSEGVPSEDFRYKEYTLDIVDDPHSSKIAPRRYAIATNKQGVVILKGPSSFSSSVQVLLDEIKFQIDNQLV